MTRPTGATIGLATAGMLAAWLAAGACAAQELPAPTAPTPEHALLAQFAGDWNAESKVTMPGEEPMIITGTETTRMLGGLWMIAEGRSRIMDMDVESLMTLGYDGTKRKYVGTFVCTGQDFLWEYVGSFDDGGRKLTLESTGPSMTDPAVRATYRETLELVDADHKVFTSSVQDADGQWHTIVTVDYRRMK
ncbi:MAG TPA: DUF1579 domain-containing protein [Lacipirellulaceae bacterium]|nr:DUF1579 domain-containing protein [Lacipirellulaceae bacterium]